MSPVGCGLEAPKTFLAFEGYNTEGKKIAKEGE
jgi:hypothetical protein